jgi:hypothetical protein
MTFIKYGPSALRSATKIKQPKPFFQDQFVALDFETDDRPASSSPDGASTNRDREAPWPVKGELKLEVWATKHDVVSSYAV